MPPSQEKEGEIETSAAAATKENYLLGCYVAIGNNVIRSSGILDSMEGGTRHENEDGGGRRNLSLEGVQLQNKTAERDRVGGRSFTLEGDENGTQSVCVLLFLVEV